MLPATDPDPPLTQPLSVPTVPTRFHLHLDAFAASLREAGYTTHSLRRAVRAAAHLCLWAGMQGLVVASVDDSTLGRFKRQLGRCKCPRLGHATVQTTEIYVRADRTAKLEAIESVLPPTLRRGRFLAPDKLLASLRAPRSPP